MTKKILLILLTIISTLIIGYGLYVLYDIVMTDVQIRIKEAIIEGIQEGVGSVVNPISWAQSLMRG